MQRQQQQFVYVYDSQLQRDVHKILNRQRGAPVGVLLLLCLGVATFLALFGTILGWMQRIGL